MSPVMKAIQGTDTASVLAKSVINSSLYMRDNSTVKMQELFGIRSTSMPQTPNLI